MITAFSFSKCLTFVGEYCGQLYQEKHQYFDLYKVKRKMG
jgi:hypothetical protein